MFEVQPIANIFEAPQSIRRECGCRRNSVVRSVAIHRIDCEVIRSVMLPACRLDALHIAPYRRPAYFDLDPDIPKVAVPADFPPS